LGRGGGLKKRREGEGPKSDREKLFKLMGGKGECYLSGGGERGERGDKTKESVGRGTSSTIKGRFLNPTEKSGVKKREEGGARKRKMGEMEGYLRRGCHKRESLIHRFYENHKGKVGTNFVQKEREKNTHEKKNSDASRLKKKAGEEERGSILRD